MVSRALRSGNFEHPGCARILDVLAVERARLPPDVLGAAVTEWVPGKSLAELITEGMIRPLAAARAVAPLAAAAEQAHRHGLVLGCDHPLRVRISPDGRAVLAFPLPRPDVTPADDVRGLGAILYTLLTSRWPLSRADAAGAGLTSAERTPSGNPVAPSSQRPGVPIELDTLVQGALGPPGELGHVRTAAAVQTLLNDFVAEDDRIALFPPTHDGMPSSPGDVWQDSNKPAPPPDPQRKRKLALGMAALGAGMLIVVGYLGVQLTSALSGSSHPAIVLHGAPPGPGSGPAAQPGSAADAGGGPAVPAGVEVYDITGSGANGGDNVRDNDRDNPDKVSRLIDGNPTSGWYTYTYKQQLPTLKPGVGVIVSFASAVQLSELTIDSAGAGSVVQVRSAPSADAPLTATVPLTQVTLGDGPTHVRLTGSPPVTHLLVWITQLGGPPGAYKTQINELTFQRAGN